MVSDDTLESLRNALPNAEISYTSTLEPERAIAEPADRYEAAIRPSASPAKCRSSRSGNPEARRHVSDGLFGRRQPGNGSSVLPVLKSLRLNFEKDYPNCKIISLEQNYRSTKNILNAANMVIKNNKEQKEKKLWSDNKEGTKIIYNRCYDERHEGSFIVSEIKTLYEQGILYDDMAVLYRTNAQSRVIEEEFLKANIPYKVVGSFYFYSRKEIKDLISYMRLVYNSNDDLSLVRCINTPKRGIGNKSIDALIRKAEENNTSIYNIINEGKELIFKTII